MVGYVVAVDRNHALCYYVEIVVLRLIILLECPLTDPMYVPDTLLLSRSENSEEN